MSEGEAHTYFIPPVNTAVGTVKSFDEVLLNSDRVVREHKIDQRSMLDDLDILMPLEIRINATAMLDWDVRPEDPEDPQQVAKAAACRKAMERVWRFEQFRRNLGQSVFFGHAANQLVWKRSATPIIGESEDGAAVAQIRYHPARWLPLHPDSVLFDANGTPVVRVRATTKDSPFGTRVSTPEGAGLRPTELGRKMLVVAAMNIEAGDFELPQQLATMFAGKSLRDRMFQAWYIKQQVLKSAVWFTQRLAWGTTIGRYREGSLKERDMVIAAIKNLSDRTATVMPASGDPNETVPGIEHFEPTGTGWQAYRELVVEYYVKRIQQMILGQTLTTGSESVGLGSNTSETHERTFARIVRMDAMAIDSAITEDVVHAIESVNWPGEEPVCRFHSLVERMDEPKFLEQIGKLVELGLPVAADDVRDRLHLRKPDPEDEQIGGRVETGFGVDLFGGGAG